MYYHAHIFFDVSKIEEVEQLHQQLNMVLPKPIFVGRVLLKAIAPFPQPMFHIEYHESDYLQVYKALVKYCSGYSMLIHPLLPDEMAAYTEYALWLGEPLVLNLSHDESN